MTELNKKLPANIKGTLPLSPSRYEGSIVITKQISKHLGKNTEILDVGYGKFYLLHVLKSIKKRFKYTGLDITDFRNVDDFKHVKRVIADVTKFKSSKKYGTITCLWVLEHIKDDKKALKSIYRLLESDGTFLLSVPSIWSWPFEFGRHGHHYYSKRKLIEMTEKEGFKIIKFFSLSGIFGWLFMIFYSWPRYLFLIMLLPGYIFLNKAGFTKQNWKKFSSACVTKTFYRYHTNKKAVLFHNAIVANLSNIDNLIKIFPSSYLLIATKK